MRADPDDSAQIPVPWRAPAPPPEARSSVTYALVGAYATLILFVIW